jgi:tetratricopeptide (TPR) repeat protein
MDVNQPRDVPSQPAEGHASPPASVSNPPTDTMKTTGGPAPVSVIEYHELGRYQVTGEIGRGGMGVVLRARDPDLNRELALKVLRGDHEIADVERRFLEEAQIAGQLQHPGIVPVHELGRDAAGRPFFAMKLVKGQTLEAQLRARSSPANDLPRFLTIFEQLCQTVAFAHSRGVIHRDLKPANIMVGAFGEVQVMDWGLAKVLSREGEVSPEPQESTTVIKTVRDVDASTSQAGSVLGTPAYMAPEQALGLTDVVDERSDVFGLGAVLCEILTGQPPFVGTASAFVLLKAAQCDLADARARLSACGADSELIALTGDCLSSEPQKRPRDASVVAGRMVAYREQVQERLRATEMKHAAAQARARAERHARRLAIGLAAAILLAILGAGCFYVHQERDRSARQAETDRRATEMRTVVTNDLAVAEKARRQEAWTDARAALDRVEVRLSETDAEDLKRELRQGRQDLELFEALDHIRQHKGKLVNGKCDVSSAAPAYAALLVRFGFDVLGMPTDVSDKVRASAVRTPLLNALDDWAFVLPDGPQRQQILAVARRSDDNTWRNRLRDPAVYNDRLQLERLAAEADTSVLSPTSLMLLAQELRKQGGDGVGLLIRAQRRHPQDYWINFTLANTCFTEKPPRLEDAVSFFRIALALRPTTSTITAGNLSVALHKLGRSEEAMAFYRESIRRWPDHPGMHDGLGLILLALGQPEKAAEEFRAAIRLAPAVVASHSHLGLALSRCRLHTEAEAACREAIRLAPRDLDAHEDLGTVLYAAKKFHEAEATDRQMIALEPEYHYGHAMLSAVLLEMGWLDEAQKEAYRSTKLKPTCPVARNRLADTLAALGHDAEAADTYRASLRIQEKRAETHVALGLVLRRQGRFAESLEALRRGHELGSQRGDWDDPKGTRLREAEHLIEVAERLPELLKRADNLSAAEQLEAAAVCLYTRRTADAARLFAAALAADPQLARDPETARRANAARAAALAGCRQGIDADQLSDAECIRLRGQALDLLRSDLTSWADRLRTGGLAVRPALRAALRRWQTEETFAGVRNPEPLAALPEAERLKWRALWVEVEQLLKGLDEAERH